MPRLGLTLSGGGLRATLFHLGVVRFLRDAGLLRKVTHIISVSGGSILGAHLALNWDQYNGSEEEFDAVASKIIDFVQSDVRNKIARRIPFQSPLKFLKQLTLRGPSRTFTSTGMLEKFYARHLYGDARVHQLPESPELHLLTTNMSEGCLCSFTRAGLIMQHRGQHGTEVDVLPARLTRIALAVAASSAFPGFFPPALITADDLGLSGGDFTAQTFTDGGVYDNLGIRAFDLIHKIDPPLDEIIVSDVGKSFNIVQPKPLGMIGRALRATDILWDRVGQLEIQNFESDPRFLFVRALDLVDPKDDPTAMNLVIQTEVAKIRTDLDRFSPLEINSLVNHGYCVARKRCNSRPESFGTNLPTNPPWEPISNLTPTQRVSDGGAQSAPSMNRKNQISSAIATEQAEELKRSANRRVLKTLFDFRDWPTYFYIPLLVLIFGFVPVHLYRYSRQANVNATIVEAITHGNPDFRKILEIVQRNTTVGWTPQPAEEVPGPLPSSDYRGFEFVSDTHMVDIRDWRRETRDVAHYYRRLRIRKLASEHRLILQYPRTVFNRADFHCSPAILKPAIRRVPPESGEGKTSWEIEFDLSDVRKGTVTDVEIEAIVYDFEARKGEGENWLRYTPATSTGEASIWVLFPESRPYHDYNLIRYSPDDPSTFQKVETRYTISHPRGSIIAWSMLKPQVGYVYECNWTTD